MIHSVRAQVRVEKVHLIDLQLLINEVEAKNAVKFQPHNGKLYKCTCTSNKDNHHVFIMFAQTTCTRNET